MRDAPPSAGKLAQSPPWSRSDDEIERTWECAPSLGLASFMKSEDDVDRVCVPFRRGPCDGCGSPPTRVAAGCLYVPHMDNASGRTLSIQVKQTLCLCDGCNARFYSSDPFYVDDLEEYVMPLYRS